MLSDPGKVYRASPGYFPTTLFPLWLAEITRRQLQVNHATSSAVRLPELPIGHPADGDWRFVPLATAGLLETAVRGLKHGEGVLHLGTHSTFRLALEAYPQFRHVLLDRNAAVVHSLTPALSPPHSAFCADLRDGTVAGKHSAHSRIVADLAL